jgi:tocopherol cyclase
MSLYKIFHPEVFQGSLKKRDYFEGWYFKHVSPDLKSAMAFIPGISLSENDPHAFIQYIDGINRQSEYFRYPIEEFRYDRKKLRVRIGDSEFSESSITLNLKNDKYSIVGTPVYTGNRKFPASITMPGIMGWYSYVPNMECNHGVVSLHHRVEGAISVNGEVIDYTGGTGYIEKDWGVSFPESWIWLQCNNFDDAGTSLMVSVAKIPWRGRYFIGLISFLSTDERTEVFATYNKSKVLSLKQLNKNTTEFVIAKGERVLTVRIAKSGSASIVAPVMGSMNKIIKESLNSEVEFSYDNGSGNIISGHGKRAGYEEMDKIFSYFGG